MVKDEISNKTVEKFEQVYSELTSIQDADARHMIAGLVSQPEFEIF